MKKNLILIISLFQLFFIGGLYLAAAQSVSSQQSAPDANTFERQVFELTNIERTKHGLPPLRWNDTLANAARAHSRDMSERRYFSHDTPEGVSPFERMRRAGYSYTTAAENIAQGQRTPEQVVNSWMNSPGHRANILNRNLTELGVGFHNYYWTQKFGTPGGGNFQYSTRPANNQQNNSGQNNTRTEPIQNTNSRNNTLGIAFAGSFGIYMNGWNQNLASIGVPLQLGLGLDFGNMRLNVLVEGGAGAGTSSFTEYLLLEWHYGGMGELYFPGKKFGLGFGYGIADSYLLLDYDENKNKTINLFNTTYMRFALIFSGESKVSIYGHLYGDNKWGFGFHWGYGW